MLRLNLSQIQLEKKDLDHYKSTHDKRQAARAAGHAVIYASNSSSNIDYWHRSSKSSASHPPWNEPSTAPLKNLASEHNPDDALISRDPVPRGSRAFWDRILAEAGTPTRAQSTGSGNGRMVDPSDEWFDNNRSATGSIEEGPDTEDDSLNNITLDLSSNEDDRKLALRTCHVSSLDTFYTTHMGSIDGTEVGGALKTSLETIQQPTSRRRLSKFFRNKSGADHGAAEQHQNPMVLGLDGHYSALPQNHDLNVSDSTKISDEDRIEDGLYGSRRDRRTISTSLETTMTNDDVPSQIHSKEPISYGLSAGPSAVLSLPIDPVRRFSAALPRSPLHISQAAASSSPEKRQAVASRGPNPPIADTSSLLSLPPRRRRNYKPRTETYSFEASETSCSPAANNGNPRSSPPEPSMPRQSYQTSSSYLPAASAGSPSPPSSIIHVEPRLPSNDYLNPLSPFVALPPSHDRLSSASSSQIHLSGNPFDLPDDRFARMSSSHVQYSTTLPQGGTEMRHFPSHGDYTSRSSSSIQMATYSPVVPSHPHTPVNPETHRSITHSTSSSNASTHSVSSHHNLSPYAPLFIPRSARGRNVTPQYPLPPPFGATPRTLSYSRAMPEYSFPMPAPSISPDSPHTPPQGNRSVANPRTPPHGTFAIYNDSLPSTMQPQTPADLHRRNPQNPFNTAPAHNRTSTLSPATADRVVARWQAFATPTRTVGFPVRDRPVPVSSPRSGSFGVVEMVSAGGENADAVTWQEREMRRGWNERVRIGREEQRRLEISPGMNRSPRRA